MAREGTPLYMKREYVKGREGLMRIQGPVRLWEPEKR
jgi:hypothetical protein